MLLATTKIQNVARLVAFFSADGAKKHELRASGESAFPRDSDEGRRISRRSAVPRPWRSLAFIAALAISGVPGQALHAAPSVPFKATVSGSVTPTSELTFDLDATGKATHMGKLDYAGQVTITSVDENGVIYDVLLETFTAANGDTLTIRCDQVGTPIGDGVIRGDDTWEVIGGTGRFAGATGSGTGFTLVDHLETFVKRLDGTIVLDR